MENHQIKVGTTILKAIYENGLSADSKLIGKKIGEPIESNIWHNCDRLISRSLITKKVTRRPDKTYYPTVYTIRPQKMEKILRMLREAYGEEIEGYDNTPTD